MIQQLAKSYHHTNPTVSTVKDFIASREDVRCSMGDMHITQPVQLLDPCRMVLNFGTGGDCCNVFIQFEDGHSQVYKPHKASDSVLCR